MAAPVYEGRLITESAEKFYNYSETIKLYDSAGTASKSAVQQVSRAFTAKKIICKGFYEPFIVAGTAWRCYEGAIDFKINDQIVHTVGLVNTYQSVAGYPKSTYPSVNFEQEFEVTFDIPEHSNIEINMHDDVHTVGFGGFFFGLQMTIIGTYS